LVGTLPNRNQKHFVDNRCEKIQTILENQNVPEDAIGKLTNFIRAYHYKQIKGDKVSNIDVEEDLLKVFPKINEDVVFHLTKDASLKALISTVKDLRLEFPSEDKVVKKCHTLKFDPTKPIKHGDNTSNFQTSTESVSQSSNSISSQDSNVEVINLRQNFAELLSFRFPGSENSNLPNNLLAFFDVEIAEHK
jgi:hypothetical protein